MDVLVERKEHPPNLTCTWNSRFWGWWSAALWPVQGRPLGCDMGLFFFELVPLFGWFNWETSWKPTILGARNRHVAVSRLRDPTTSKRHPKGLEGWPSCAKLCRGWGGGLQIELITGLTRVRPHACFCLTTWFAFLQNCDSFIFRSQQQNNCLHGI